MFHHIKYKVNVQGDYCMSHNLKIEEDRQFPTNFGQLGYEKFLNLQDFDQLGLKSY